MPEPLTAAYLIHEPGDWSTPWQWWTTGRTEDNRDYADHMYRKRMDGHCYVAGFVTKSRAIEYGRQNGWSVEVDPGTA